MRTHKQTKSSRKNFRKEIKEKLFKRSGGLCEVCNTAIVLDNHHIIEHSLGGLDKLDNLIQVCPNCHRQIPKYLNSQQQDFIISEVNELKAEANHKFFLKEKVIRFGGNLYVNCNNLIQVNKTNIFYLKSREIRSDTVSDESEYILHVVMLEDYTPQILVLGNRIIFGENIDICITKNCLELSQEGEKIFSMEDQEGVLNVNASFKFKGQQFIFSDDGSNFAGPVWRGITFDNSLMGENGTVFSINI